MQSPTPVSCDAASPSTCVITLTSVAAGNLIVVNVGYVSETITVSTMADDQSNTYVLAYGPVDDSSADVNRAYEYYVKSAVGGTTVITATLSGNVGGAGHIHATEYSGADTSAPLDGAPISATFDASSAPSAGNITTSAAGVIHGFFRVASGKLFTAGTNYTVNSTSARSDTERRLAAAGTYAVDGSYSTTEDGIATGSAYKEAGAATGRLHGSDQLLLRGGGL